MAPTDSPKTSFASIDEIHRRVVACAKGAASFDIRAFEEGTAKELNETLVPLVRKLLDEALALNAHLLACFDAKEPTLVSAEAENEEDRNQLQIADFAFICAMELRHRMSPQRLAAMENGWDVIAECDITLLRIINACAALEGPLAALVGVERELDGIAANRSSVEIRRQYARLFRAVDCPFPTDQASMVKAFRCVGTAIAMIVGHEVYRDMRFFDRRQIRALQTRVLDWLRNPEAPGAFAEGTRLWQDVIGASAMLRQINRREDLVRHDTELVAELLENEDCGRGTARLRSLLGLDPELDAFIEQGKAADRERVCATLKRLAASFRANAKTGPSWGNDGPASARAPIFGRAEPERHDTEPPASARRLKTAAM